MFNKSDQQCFILKQQTANSSALIIQNNQKIHQLKTHFLLYTSHSMAQLNVQNSVQNWQK